jgi:MoaA/NifB/PqqE/SkfB family radical SAM enzyme
LKDKKEKQMTLDTLTYICDFFERSRKRKLNVLGGEPSLHPEFDVFLEYLISRGFVVHVFSNGMMPRAKLEAVEASAARRQLTRRRLKFVVNVNEETYRTSEENRLQDRTFQRLHHLCSLSFNIFETRCRLDFLVDLIVKYKLIPEIRLGLAAPITGKGNRFLLPRDFRVVAEKISAFSSLCRDNDVDLVLDCGFPLCIFTDEEIGKLYKSKTQLKFVCHPIPDIDADLNVTHCYPLSGYFPGKLTQFRDLKQVHSYFRSLLTRNSGAPGIFEACGECVYRRRGMCTGGCKGHFINVNQTEAEAA